MRWQFSDSKKIVKFLISGGSAAAVEYAFFILIILWGATAVVAQPVSFCAGLAVSFLLNKHWVFSSKGSVKKEIPAFIALGLTNLVVTTGIVWIFTDYLHILPLIAKVIVMGMVACWNFIIFNKMIFRMSH